MLPKFLRMLTETDLYDEVSSKKLFDDWDKYCIVRMNTNGTWRKKL